MKKRKIFALLLSFTLLLGIAVPAALADGEDSLTVTLRIEGLEECLYFNAACAFTAGDEAGTVADLLKSLDGTDGFPSVTIEDGTYGAYIADIDGTAQMSRGEMSGWVFTVNGEVSSVGISGYEVKDGDDIIVFFSDLYGSAGMQFPVADLSKLLTDGVVTFTSADTVYDEEWNPSLVINPVVGATVIWDGEEYTTDEDGAAAVPAVAGFHTVQIARYDEQADVPTVLRFAPGCKVFVPFTDMVANAWYTDAIEYCVAAELFAGMGENKFDPDGKMTMAQLVTVLSRIADAVTVSSSDDPWYAGVINWAIDAGVMHDSSYSPNAEVTREIFIYMFYKTAELVGDDISVTADIADATDFDSITGEFADAVAWAVATGLITGVSEGELTIDPSGLVSRAAVCQMLMRYYS